MASIILCLEAILAFLAGLAHWLPTTPQTQGVILNCLDRNEVFFEFDYFIAGGHSRTRQYCAVDSSIVKFGCQVALTAGMVMSSNLLELFLTGKVLWEMKKQTQSSISILTQSTYKRRVR